MPSREDVVAYFAERTGRDVNELGYYPVLCRWRSVCMIEYKVAESVQGLSSPENGQRFAELCSSGFADAERLARSLC